MQVIASIERQFRDLLVVNERADGCIFGLNERRLCLHRYGVCELPDLQCDIHLPHITQIERYSMLGVAFETGGLNADGIFAEPERRSAILATLIGVNRDDGIRADMN